MFKKLLGLLAVIGTIFGAIAGSKKSKELKELENKIDESKKEEKSVETKIAKLEKNKKKNKKEITSLKRKQQKWKRLLKKVIQIKPQSS
jgi:predicted  nucleic acid-binding Zn-ribbon protein